MSISDSLRDEDRELLEKSIDRVLKITCRDGEVLFGRILHVFNDEQDFAYDLVSTNRIDKYEKSDVQPAYVLSFADVRKVETP